jgi:hypothetical protein
VHRVHGDHHDRRRFLAAMSAVSERRDVARSPPYLEVDAAQRYQSASHVAFDLRHAKGKLPGGELVEHHAQRE